MFKLLVVISFYCNYRSVATTLQVVEYEKREDADIAFARLKEQQIANADVSVTKLY